MIKFFSILILLCAQAYSFGQYDMDKNKDTTANSSSWDKQKHLSRTYVGGQVSLQFGSFTYIHLSPFIGYEFKKPFSAGISTTYQLFRTVYPNGGILNSHAYGAGTFFRAKPFSQLILQAELNWFNAEDFATSSNLIDRTNLAAFMAGIGYAGDLGGKSYYQLLLLYDFIDDPNMPLPKLITGIPLYYRIGMVFYLGERSN